MRSFICILPPSHPPTCSFIHALFALVGRAIECLMILSLLACVRVGVRICLFSGWLVCLRRVMPRSIIHLTDCVMSCFFSQAALGRSCSQLLQSTTLQSLAPLGKIGSAHAAQLT
jgi:hypothetical protein